MKKLIKENKNFKKLKMLNGDFMEQLIQNHATLNHPKKVKLYIYII